MFVITMRKARRYNQGEYEFNNKKECQEFLESLNSFDIEQIISIEKYNKHSFRSAWNDFFN